MNPIILQRSEHPLSRSMIDEEALKVLYRLHRHGFLAYLVGGSVRDLLLGKKPKDFDVVTNAHPHQIRELFRNSRIIGRRFRLVHVFFKGGKVIEVSTFRSHSEFEAIEASDASATRTDAFGTPEEDALRRDITINGLFYNIADFTIIDYVGGVEDLRKGIIRTIGDPDEKFIQDPVRMIRVIRHAARTGFPIEEKTYQALLVHREKIKTCAPSRVREEFLRELKEGYAVESLRLMINTGLLFPLFPDLKRALGGEGGTGRKNQEYLLSLFHLVDRMVREGQTIPDAILLACFVTPFLQALPFEHPFLPKNVQSHYRNEMIRWAVHQLLNPFSVQKGTKELTIQVLAAQWNLRHFLQRGMLPKKFRTKRYFKDAVLFFGLEAEAKGEKVPRLIRNAVPPGFLPWWPKELRIKRRPLHHPP
ncbi:MAG: polynucleotide adenylyltransferase PcnB [Desulfobacterota bacterium]|nr:polynucleotide adenylyltransferase PcnB [Thermodesulfobacteriota bacterium]